MYILKSNYTKSENEIKDIVVEWKHGTAKDSNRKRMPEIHRSDMQENRSGYGIFSFLYLFQ